jgi:hypothetical protein
LANAILPASGEMQRTQPGVRLPLAPVVDGNCSWLRQIGELFDLADPPVVNLSQQVNPGTQGEADAANDERPGASRHRALIEEQYATDDEQDRGREVDARVDQLVDRKKEARFFGRQPSGSVPYLLWSSGIT